MTGALSSMESTEPFPSTEWITLVPFETLPVDRGAAFLVGTQPVAIFRLTDGTLAALDHHEPFTGVPVMARGLIGSTGDQAWVASPLHKQRFDLRTGKCLDDPNVAIRTWAVYDVDGWVLVSATPLPLQRSPAPPAD